ncbi:MAG: fumarylacetoacetate hydrolase family protein [Agriterribacter sp.]
MKLVSYLRDGQDQLALLADDLLYNMDEVHPNLPGSMGMFLNYWEDALPLVQNAAEAIKAKRFLQHKGFPFKNAQLLSPVAFPTSLRDAYAFRQHVEMARKNRGVAMIPEFDQFPVFYFSNHHSVQGAGDVRCMPDHLQQLDFELEVAIVINKHCRNIKAEVADEYIAGLMIMNDFSARQLQLEEMKLNLGPAKGKDFATALGPVLVTLDELAQFEVPAKENHTGRQWDLNMKCRVNGIEVSTGNLSDMEWTFAEIIERASYGTDLFPGDIIGSGTSGAGCFLELNGSGKRNDLSYTEQWLQPGDVVELEVDGLGILQNTIVQEDQEENWSILARKK